MSFLEGVIVHADVVFWVRCASHKHNLKPAVVEVASAVDRYKVLVVDAVEAVVLGANRVNSFDVVRPGRVKAVVVLICALMKLDVLRADGALILVVVHADDPLHVVGVVKGLAALVIVDAKRDLEIELIQD